jgi:DNA-binding SARP family transcriptional activator
VNSTPHADARKSRVRSAPEGGAAPLDHDGAALAIADPQGAVLWQSAALRRRLERARPGARTCCELLACRANTAHREVRCLTRQALAGGSLEARPWRATPDVAPHGHLSAEVIQAPSGPMVLFDLALAEPEERLEGAAGPVADVEVLALGRLSVRIDGQCVDGDWLQQRPGQTFRFLLASRSGAARSEEIANALWPDRGPGAIANVRYCIYKVREQIDDRPAPVRSLILRGAGGYRLDPERLVVDADIFQAKVAAGLEVHRAGRAHAADALLAEALALYRGDFLADDPYAEWAFTEREYLRSLAGKALAARAQIALAEERLEAASACLLRLAQLEPFDSQVHQRLIQVCLRRGRRTEAVRHYSALRLRLARAFGEKPDFDLAHVAADITSGSV